LTPEIWTSGRRGPGSRDRVGGRPLHHRAPVSTTPDELASLLTHHREGPGPRVGPDLETGTELDLSVRI